MKKHLSLFYRLHRQRVFTISRRLSALLIISVCLPALTHGQSKVWEKVLGGNRHDELKSVQSTRDGGYILGGTSSSGKSGDKSQPYHDTREMSHWGIADYWVVKVKADGTKEWDKTFGGSSGDYLTTIQQTKDGGYILGGSSHSTKSGDKTEDRRGSDAYPYDYWVVKLRADGTKEWDRTFGGPKGDELYALRQTPDGGYILGGTSGSGKSGDKSEASKGLRDYWIIKLNSNGSKAWDKTIGGNNQDELSALQLTPDGGYLLGGTSSSGKKGNKTAISKGGQDYWVVKVSATGIIQWDKTLGGLSNDKLSALLVTPDGGYLVGGTSPSGKSGNKSQTTKGKTDYWVVKLKADGSTLWDKVIGGTSFDQLTSLQLTRDKGYLLAGSSVSDKSADKTQASRDSSKYTYPDFNETFTDFGDYWVVKLNAEGHKVWDKTIGGESGDRLVSVLAPSNGGYLLAGSSNSYISGDKAQSAVPLEYENNVGGFSVDYWLLKLDDNIRQNQDITFASIPQKTSTDPAFTLQASASSGLPVTFQVVSGAATIKGNQLTLTGAGKITVRARQAGNATHNPVEDVQTFTVLLAHKEQDFSYGGSSSDTLTTLLATADGGHLMGGTSVSGVSADKSQPNQGNPDFWVVKSDAAGKKLWDKTFGGKSADRLTALVATADGGYLLGGTSASGKSGDKSQTTKGKTDYWIIKIDAQGNKVWDKTYGGNQADMLSAILVTKDGFLLGGSSVTGVSGDKSQSGNGGIDYWVVSIDEQGNKQWDKTFGGNQKDVLAAMVTTPRGYLLGGTSNSTVSGDKSQAPRGDQDYWVVAISDKGDKQWDKTYGGIKPTDKSFPYIHVDYYRSGGSELRTMALTPDGGFLLGGTSNAAKGAERSKDNLTVDEDMFVYFLKDYWVVKIDKDGNKLWDQSFNGYDAKYITRSNTKILYTGNSELSSIVALPEGGYLLGGTSNAEKGNDKSENSPRVEIPSKAASDRNDYWMIKIDEQGNFQGDKTIGGDQNDQLAAVALASDGSYLLGGTSFSGAGSYKNATNKGEADFWVAKINDGSRPALTAWDMRYGGLGTDNLTSVIKTSDGGYLSGGYTYSGKNGDKTEGIQGKIDYWIVKSDKNGKKLWDKRFGGSFDDFLNRVIQTNDGGYLLAGSSRSGKSGDKSESSRDTELGYSKARDFWLVKVDAAGNKQWDKTLGGSGLDELEKVIQLSSGEYVLAGHSNSPASGDKSQGTQGGYDYWLVKVDTKGNKIWDKRFGGTQDERLGSFTQTRDGGFLLGGTSQSGINGDKSEASRGKSDYWIVRTDKDGNKLWDKTFGGTGSDQLSSVGRSNGDTFFLAGTSSSPQSGDKTHPGYVDELGYVSSDYWVIKIDAQGNKIWDKAFGSNQSDALEASTYTRDGGYLLGGISYASKSGDKTENGRGSWDFWLVKLDANGSKQWDKTIGGTEREELRTVFQTNDGGYLVAGSSASGVSGDKTQPSQGFSDYWLVKLAPDTSPVVAARAASVTEESVSLTNALTAYPNPFQDKVSVQFTLPQTQAATVKVYDGQGNEVATLFNGEAKANQQYEVEWNASNKTIGLYFLQLQTPTKKQQQKLLLTK